MKIVARSVVLTLLTLLSLMAANVWAQVPVPMDGNAGGNPAFTQQELGQMLAPVALYPDALLSQVLMAATYPLEVVEAARWLDAHPGLSGDAALLAAAADEGYAAPGLLRRQPYHGYYFRMLKAQGPGAADGARNYVVNGKMIGGFAVLAYPARYGASGVTSFMVSHDGVIVEKDLGPNTHAIAAALNVYDPAGWKKSAAPR